MKIKIKNNEVIHKIKPWMYLSTYIICLTFFLFHMNEFKNGITFIISLFKTLIYAVMIAYVLNLPMKKIEEFLIQHIKKDSFMYRKRRVISMIITFIAAILLVSAIISIILPSIIESLISLMQNLSTFFMNIVKNIDQILAYFHIEFRIENIDKVNQFIEMPWEKIFSNAVNFLSGSASGLLSGATSFISKFAVIFTAFMFSLYLLSGKESYLRQVRKTVVAICGYESANKVFYYGHRINKVFSKFIGGQLTEAGILWVIYYVSMRIFHFPYPELISTLIAICSFVPVFGPMFAMGIGSIMMLSKDPMQSLWFIVFYQILSYFEDNVIYPRVVGNSVGLPGLWVLACIFIFNSLWGIFGMIIAVPTTACIYVFFADYVNKKLKQMHLIVDENGVYDYEEKKE